MGEQSLVGITNVVAGEKDPRNLMLIFSMLRVLMLEWDISSHTEAMFDSVYAYFPITFRPPPNDPYGITAQDLKVRLRDCLASTGLLAPHTIPSLLDRLDSTSPAVKRDVLDALNACAENYDPSILTQYSITLWDAIKFEVLQAQEPELAEEALNVIQSIAANLSRSSNTSATASPLIQYLRSVTKQCLEHLQEPASRQAKASGDILKATASASTQSFDIVIKKVGPSLLTAYQAADGILQQRAILEVINQLFEAAVEIYGSWNSTSSKNVDGRENLLVDFKDKYIAIYSQALMGTVKEEVSFRLTAAQGLLLISQMRSLLQDSEIGLFVQYYDEIILKEESYGRDELKRQAVTALTEISKFKPDLIADITFPAFMAELPDTEKDAAQSDYRPVLEALSVISTEKDLLETLMRRLLNKLDVLFRAHTQGSFPYTCAILDTIQRVLEETLKTSSISLTAYYDRVVVGLSKLSTSAREGPLQNESVLDVLGRVQNIIIRKCSTEQIMSVADNVYTLFRDEGFASQDVRPQVSFDPPSVMILSTWLLAALPRSLSVPLLQRDQIIRHMRDLVVFAEGCDDNAVELNCLRQVALYVNKHLSTTDFDVVNDILSQRLAPLASSSFAPQTIQYNLRLCFMLIKASVMRLAPNTNTYLEQLVDLLNSSKYSPFISRQAAPLFRILLASDEVLSKTNDVQSRLLTPQRVFQTLTPLFSRRFREASLATEKENYLVALSGLLSTVPQETVMPELPTLLPLLLQSLDISNENVKIATLETLAVVIVNNASVLEESGHIPALTKRLIAVSHFPKGQNKTSPLESLSKTRRLATRCLSLLPKYIAASGLKANPLLSLKHTVLNGLMSVLDDPKRDVRKEAVDARASWLRGVDDIEEDDED